MARSSSKLDGPAEGGAIVLYDGGCGLCHRFVRFVAARDPRAVHRFAALDTATGRALLERHGAPSGLDSAVLVDADGLHVESTAALRILRRLRFPWPLAALLLCVPRALRDRAYRAVARRRLRAFGAASGCPLPDPALRSRIVED
ncbi:MAG: hypothetical protein RL112_1494 [Planctomycetota bacterium]|jgi:predicted DCC family thiol-disulfide oxidoreductase YuxK